MNRPRSFPPRCVALPRLPLVLAVAFASAHAPLAFAQPSPADGPWAGSVQCVLEVQTGAYTRQETQTWTLVSNTPVRTEKDIRFYRATWTASGHGSIHRSQAGQTSDIEWTINVPAQDVELAVLVRASDENIVFRQWGKPLSVPGALTGTRRVTLNGTPQPVSTLPPDAAEEWVFGWLTDSKAGTAVQGNKTVDAAPLPANYFWPNAPRSATCTWKFSHPRATSGTDGQRSPAPQLLTITPATVDQGATGVQVTLAAQGTRWQNGATTADFGPDITSSLNVTSDHDAVAVLNVAPSAAIGPRKVTITTANATRGGRPEEVGLPDTFKVNVVLTATTAPGLVPLPALPSISQVTPNWAAQGAANVSVTLTGFSTHFAAGTSKADFGPDISAPLHVSSPTGATATLSVATAAATGPRTVSVTTGSEIAKLKDGFTVTRLPPAPPAPVTSGNYRVILNGFRVNSRTFEGIETDGPGDEVYASARVHLCARTGGGVVVAPGVFEKSISEVKTAVHGCIGSSFPGRVRAGSADQFGGLRNGDVFPTGQDPARTSASPVPRSFPFLLWEGPLSDGNEVVIVEPSLWEWDGDPCVYTEWEHEAFLNSQQTKDRVHDRVVHADLAPIDADAALGILCFNSYQLPNVSNVCQCQPGKDRPIGLKEGDYQSARYRSVAVVVTREAIEKALTSSPPTGGLPPGVITIPLVDEGFNFSGNYDLFLRVERVAEVTAATAPVNTTTTEAREPTADTTPVNVTRNAAPEGTPSTLANATVVPFTPAFQVSSLAPALMSVTPNSSLAGAPNLRVTLTGKNTHFANGTTTVSFGPDIIVTAVTVDSATSATAILNISRSAAAGPRAVTLTTGAEAVTLANGFTVTGASDPSSGMQIPATTPAIVSVTPNSGSAGALNLRVTLTGNLTHFAPGATTANFGPGIDLVGLTVDSATSATAMLRIDPSAQPGARTIIVTTGAERVALTDGFSVTSSAGAPVTITTEPGTPPQGPVESAGDLRAVPTPAITQISPNVAARGAGAPPAHGFTVTLASQLTHFAQGQTTVNFGQGTSVTSTTVTSPTSAELNLMVYPVASFGPRAVTVTTGPEVVLLPNGFTVTPSPDSISKDPYSATSVGYVWQRGSSVRFTGRLHTQATQDWFDLSGVESYCVGALGNATVTITLQDVSRPSEFDLNLYEVQREISDAWLAYLGDIPTFLLASTASSPSAGQKTMVLRLNGSWTYQRSGDPSPSGLPNSGFNQLFRHFAVSVTARTWQAEECGFTLLVSVQ